MNILEGILLIIMSLLNGWLGYYSHTKKNYEVGYFNFFVAGFLICVGIIKLTLKL